MASRKIREKKNKSMFKIIWIISGTLIHLFNLILLMVAIKIPKLDDGGLGGIGLALAIGYLLTLGLGLLILYWLITISFFIYRRYWRLKKK
ncbi:hypothetical protein HYX08_07305 [Candidatus Woesearchaeota archaeon]|nr:hypothetical protein [Candidatus Woesearchaeota archaeon]